MTDTGVIEVRVTCPECGEPLEVDRTGELWTAGVRHGCIYRMRDKTPADYEPGSYPALPVAFEMDYGWDFYEEQVSLELVGSDL